MTYCKIDVNNCSSSFFALRTSSFLLSARAHFCSRLVLIFVPGSCSILLSARAHFCSRLVLIFVLGSCSFLFSARAHFCSATTARTHFRSPTVSRTRDLPSNYTRVHAIATREPRASTYIYFANVYNAIQSTRQMV